MSTTSLLLRFGAIGLVGFSAMALTGTVASLQPLRNLLPARPSLVCANDAQAGIRYCFDANATQPSFPVPLD